ncbi:ABC transporter ATP-binding protein [Streptomyces uncialis]|uniref:ABC transporter ATP-binding protein n=1 Tax=Streptomyces uncialis TaxID=1048205 RepID=UPI00224FFD23|nr:ABC transporter ATP-binding protein [Streptomyces uncialis]MCX4662251.1 ABC transporter ATP-binding protein/permease [Streptomyces uncialis]
MSDLFSEPVGGPTPTTSPATAPGHAAPASGTSAPDRDPPASDPPARGGPAFVRLRVLWSFARPHKGRLALGLVLALLGSAMELATPMATKAVLDTLSGDVRLAWPITVLLALLAVGAFVGLWQAILLGTVAERIVLDARESVVRRYFRAALLPLSGRSTGELATRVTSDTVLLREAASSSVVGLINGAVLLVGTLVLMGTLDLVLLGVTVGAVVVIAVVFLLLMPGIATEQEKAQEALGRMGGALEGALRALRTVKAARAEERMADRVVVHARTAAAHGTSAVRREAVAWTVAFAGIQLAVIGILGFGAWRVSAGHLEVSSLIAFLLYMFTLMGPVTELSTHMTALQSGIAAAARIREVEAIPLETAPTAPAGHPTTPPGKTFPAPRADRPVLELRAVTARYAPGTEPAVRSLDLAVPARGHTAVVGPSGAGKTTLFSLLLRFLDAEHGELRLDGTPYTELSAAEVRARFAYVEQDTPLIPGTLRENLLLGHPDAAEDDLYRVLDEVRLGDHARALPEGLDTELSATSLSGGQRQRVALARALLRAPDVLLLDEATAQIDALTEAAVTEYVRAHADRAAVISIAHRLSTVISADRIVVMEDGRVRAVGTHQELLRADRLYRDLVEALHMSGVPGDPGARTPSPSAEVEYAGAAGEQRE